MELAPANVPLFFEVTFSSSALPVAMSVYNVSGESPVLIQGPLAMVNVIANTYLGSFTASQGLSYLIFKAVYTDDTYEILDENYYQASETIIAEALATNGGVGAGCSIIGYVVCTNTIPGLVNC
jgi:hypothetical protein